MLERVVITGGAGFIGHNLIDELNDHGYETISADKHFSENANHSLHGDLLLPGEFAAVLDEMQPNQVIHLAAQVGREFGEDDIRHTIRENAELTGIVATECQKHHVALAYASTSEVYGDQGPHRSMNEDGPFVLPHNLYGLSKRWGEEVVQLYAGFDTIIWRLSMPYGPGAPPGRGRRALDNMLWQAHHRMPITVHEGAERSWCWVGDTVRAMRMTLEARKLYSSNIHDHFPPQIYNVGRDDDPRSMLEIAQMACDLADAPLSLIKNTDSPSNQTSVKRLCTDKIRQLGWKPEIELEDGMDQVYGWVKQFDVEGVRT